MTATRRVRFSLTELEARDVPAANFLTLPIYPTSDPAVLDNARAIVARGQLLGRRVDAFMKVGDSNTSTGGFAVPQYLNPLGDPAYNAVASGLANYGAYLLQTLAAFRAPVTALGENSFTRYSTAAYPGWTAPIVLPRVAGEVAVTNAGVALVMIGTNDIASYANPALYRTFLSQIVETLTAAGVVPVLSTLPDHADNPGYLPLVMQFNQAVADVGEQYRVPVWNLYDRLAGLPHEGLDAGGVHLTSSPNGGGSFFPGDLGFGQNARNLDALVILDWFRRAVASPAPVDPPTRWTPLPATRPVFALGRDVGQGPAVEVRDAATGELINRFVAFPADFDGGVHVSTADVNGDGFTDVMATPGPGGGPVVHVISGADGTELATFFAFDPGFRNGFSVAAGDLDGDGRAEIVVGAGDGGGPAVAVFHGGDFDQVQSFFAYDPGFRGGVNVAVGTFAGVGPAIVAGAGVGGGPQVELFRYREVRPATSFFVFDDSVRSGVSVAAGDLTGRGSDAVVAVPAAGTPDVKVIDPRAGLLREFTADAGATGARPTVVRSGDRVPGRLLIANGPGGATAVFASDGLDGSDGTVFADPGRVYGLYVG
jgi:hypothetical protein